MARTAIPPSTWNQIGDAANQSRERLRQSSTRLRRPSERSGHGDMSLKPYAQARRDGRSYGCRLAERQRAGHPSRPAPAALPFLYP